MSRPTQDTDRPSLDFAYGALTLSGALSQTLLLSSEVPCLSPTTPQINLPVWALSCSLAATWEIDISFSSCSYLDVSVHCVFPP